MQAQFTSQKPIQFFNPSAKPKRNHGPCHFNPIFIHLFCKRKKTSLKVYTKFGNTLICYGINWEIKRKNKCEIHLPKSLA